DRYRATGEATERAVGRGAIFGESIATIHACHHGRVEHAPVILNACPTPRGYRMTPDGPRPRACRRLACGYCGPRLALSTVKAIELAAPIGSAVVTLPHVKLPAGDRARLRA